MNEAETRAGHIDPALKAAGWGVVEGSRIRREYPITLGRIEGRGRRGKPLTADYVLEYRNTKLGVVEAKADTGQLTEGVGQAKDYAGKLAVRFAYATNGTGIYQVDLSPPSHSPHPAEGVVPRYPTPEELWAMTFAKEDAWRERFAGVPYEDKGGSHPSRYYQDIAIERVLQAIAEDKDRILLTLATGTGKTFIAFQVAWKLFHSRWNRSGKPTRRPRILFLADRNILANQAFNAFSAFPEDALVRISPADIRKKGKVPKNGNLFFTIFQTFMSGPLVDGAPSPCFGNYPPDFFDQLAEMQKIIDAEDSDLFDVLAHVAYAVAPLTREVRASNAKVYINTRFDAKRQVFLAFVLQHYVAEGVEELAQDKLAPLLRLKYQDSIADAITDLGEDIGEAFIDFQKSLYVRLRAEVGANQK